MFAEKLVLFFAVIFLLQQNVSGFNGNRIVNGSATPDGVYEFLPKLTPVLQRYKETDLSGGVCSSTIITNRHILTAAHCVITSGVVINRVLLNLIESRPKEHPGRAPAHIDLRSRSFQTRYYFHSSYSFTRFFRDDIAIIEFPEGTNFNITPITLASNYVEKESDTAMAAGYGIYKWKGDPTPFKGIPERPDVLQNATVPVILNCPVPDDYQNTTICAGDYKVHADEGDSGGPLMIERNKKMYQIGVLSLGGPGQEKNTHFVYYTRVSSYCNWISMITKGQAKCQPLPDELKPPQPINPNNNVTPKHSDPESQSGTSTIGFTFNILVFFFIGIFYFA